MRFRRLSHVVLAAGTACAVAAHLAVATADPAAPAAATTATTDAPRPSVPDYKSPGLSSVPSSGEPGLSYAARGLSSQIVDPIGGINGIFMGLFMLSVMYRMYETYLGQQQLQARLQGLPEPRNELALLGSSGPESLSSQIPRALATNSPSAALGRP